MKIAIMKIDVMMMIEMVGMIIVIVVIKITMIIVHSMSYRSLCLAQLTTIPLTRARRYGGFF